MQEEKPKNQWALVVYLLLENKLTGLTMKTACADIFYKFQTRLGEVEKGRKDKLKVRRLRMKKKNRFGHNMTYINYKSLAPKPYLRNLIAKLNRQGLKT